MTVSQPSSSGLQIVTTRPFPQSLDVALLGDSRNAQNHSSNAAPTQQAFAAARGWGIWVESLTRGSIRFPFDLNFAVSGTDAVDMVTGNPSPSQNAANSRAGMVVIHCCTNGFQNNVTAATEIGYVTTVIKQQVAAGKMVGIFAEQPRGDSTNTGVRLTAAQLQQMHQYRDWVRRRSGARSISPQVFVIDLWPDIADQTFNLTTGDVLIANSYDSKHLNTLGSYVNATRFLKSLGTSTGFPAPLVVPTSFLIETASELFDATNLTTGNLLANGMLGGTGGGNVLGGFGVSGTFPTSWTASNASAGWQSGSPTLVGSQQTTSTGNWWQGVLGGSSGATSNPTVTIQQALTLGNLNAGDVLQMAADIEVDASASGFTCPYIELQASLPSAASNTVRCFAPSDSDAWGPTALFQGTFLTPPLTIAGTETAVNARINMQIIKSSSPSANVRFRKVRVWKVI